jgi:hypothetical protein
MRVKLQSHLLLPFGGFDKDKESRSIHATERVPLPSHDLRRAVAHPYCIRTCLRPSQRLFPRDDRLIDMEILIEDDTVSVLPTF